ncbi:MAG TPA: protein kinase [Acidimicrobiales bacterium]|nr:protein kinase [Acidimicrobiales bacterium]
MSSPNPSQGASTEAVPSVSGAPPQAGRVLAGRYRLDSLLASGGMAQVWQGTDEVLRRQVAVKILHTHLAADDTFVTRFRQEAVAAARLAHPGIVAIYDTCSEGGVEAIVMELVPGQTLRQRLDDPEPIDPWQAAGLAAQVADALDAAHRAGLVHRDIKPANVLLPGDGRVKVADFGIAKAVADADLTQPGLMVGTAKYLAPEQVRGEAIDARTDLYSLGVVLYEMLCGRPPFRAETDAATALMRLQKDPLKPRQVRPSVPKALEEVVWRAMAREPADRYQSATELRAALLSAGAAPLAEPDVTSTTIEAAPGLTAGVPRPVDPGAPSAGAPAPVAPSFRQTERSWLVPTAVVVVVALVLGLAGLLLGRSGAGDLLGGVRDAIGGGSDTAAAAVTVTDATAFDPSGDGHENDDDTDKVRDGDPATSWQTEGYNDRDITKLKDGVGIMLTLDQARTLDHLEIDSPTNDWKIQVFVAGAPAGDLAGWGEAVATTEGLPAGTNNVDLGGAKGSAVLVWILDRGDAKGRAAARIDEIRVVGS